MKEAGLSRAESIQMLIDAEFEFVGPLTEGVKVKPGTVAAKHAAAAKDAAIAPGLTVNPSRSAADLAPMNDPWTGRASAVRLDQFGPNVAVDYVRRLLPRSIFTGPEPTMFAAGPLPPILASGADPSVLWQLPWSLRHSGAAAPNRGLLLKLLEEADDEPDHDRLQTPKASSGLPTIWPRSRLGRTRRRHPRT